MPMGCVGASGTVPCTYECAGERERECVCGKVSLPLNGSAQECLLDGVLMCVHGEDLSVCFCELKGVCESSHSTQNCQWVFLLK